jgi:hypothetical protein
MMGSRGEASRTWTFLSFQRVIVALKRVRGRRLSLVEDLRGGSREVATGFAGDLRGRQKGGCPSCLIILQIEYRCVFMDVQLGMQYHGRMQYVQVCICWVVSETVKCRVFVNFHRRARCLILFDTAVTGSVHWHLDICMCLFSAMLILTWKTGHGQPSANWGMLVWHVGVVDITSALWPKGAKHESRQWH